MTVDQDVFGTALLEWVSGGTRPEVLERDDGFTQLGAGPEVYLAGFRGWPVAERQSIRHLRGRVLDVGCGAGRVATELQRRDIDVIGLDTSPLAADAARLRGVRTVWSLPLEDLGNELATFDSLILFGNNFGIFRTTMRARQVLRRLALETNSGARMFIESTDPYFGGAPAMNRAYFHRNQFYGRSPGQVKLRYHYGHLRGPWFNWIFVSRRELRTLLVGTGWRIERIVGTALGEPYVAILTKTTSA